MTAPYDEFLPEVLPYVHGAPDLMALNAIRNSAIEFCEMSLIWQYTPPVISIVAGTSAYTISLPAQTRLANIYTAWFEGRSMGFKSADELALLYGRDWRAISSAPRFITYSDPNLLILAPTPDQASVGGLSLVVALAPTRASTGVDDTLFERWLEPIAMGARSRLHSLAGQAFSDPSQAGVERSMFLNGMTKATIARNRAYSRAQIVARPAVPW